MKCALELKQIADSVKEERKRKKKIELTENCIRFCEDYLAPLLEEEAKNGCDETLLFCNFTWENYLRILVSHTSRAGNTYYTYNSSIKELDLDIIKWYLKQFCIDVKFREQNVPTSNGHYYTHGGYLTFSFANPDCLSDN